MSLAASIEQGGVSENMDWRERTYYLELVRKCKAQPEAETRAEEAKGEGDDKLPPMQNPRLEIHQGTYGDVLVTLTDRTVDNTMFLAEIEDGIPPRIYVGHYEPEKRAEDYVTFEPWREG